jgi:diguanylate cyclase (GGDEF)-like protein
MATTGMNSINDQPCVNAEFRTLSAPVDAQDRAIAFHSDLSHDPFSLALEMVSSPIFLFSAQGDIVFANTAAGDYVTQFHSIQPVEFSLAVHQAMKSMKPDSTDGEGRFQMDRLLIKSLAVGFDQFFSVQVEIGAFQAHPNLEFLAYHDELTGLKNYRGYQKSLENLSQRNGESTEFISLILVDVDNFKYVNDTWGHAFGNWVLEEIGQFLANSIRRGDEGFRIGGDEFAILSYQSSAEKSRDWAHRIHASLTAHLHRSTGNSRLSVSMGCAQVPPGGFNSSQIFQIADTLLYQAKQSGKSSIFLG